MQRRQIKSPDQPGLPDFLCKTLTNTGGLGTRLVPLYTNGRNANEGADPFTFMASTENLFFGI